MPLYDYECVKCGHGFELRKSFDESPEAACPRCEGETRRLFSPVPIVFKGSGFYVTDSRRNGNGKGRGESIPGEDSGTQKETSSASEKESTAA